MILYAMLFLGVLLYYFYAIKSNQLAFLKIGIYTFYSVLCYTYAFSRYWEDLVFLFENKLATSSRYTINYCGLQTISDSFLLGTNQTLQNKLNACYDQYGFQIIKKNINSHNQYLDYF
jgi:hypothetical protein